MEQETYSTRFFWTFAKSGINMKRAMHILKNQKRSLAQLD